MRATETEQQKITYGATERGRRLLNIFLGATEHFLRSNRSNRAKTTTQAGFVGTGVRSKPDSYPASRRISRSPSLCQLGSCASPSASRIRSRIPSRAPHGWYAERFAVHFHCNLFCRTNSMHTMNVMRVCVFSRKWEKVQTCISALGAK